MGCLNFIYFVTVVFTWCSSGVLEVLQRLWGRNWVGKFFLYNLQEKSNTVSFEKRGEIKQIFYSEYISEA